MIKYANYEERCQIPQFFIEKGCKLISKHKYKSLFYKLEHELCNKSLTHLPRCFDCRYPLKTQHTYAEKVFVFQLLDSFKLINELPAFLFKTETHLLSWTKNNCKIPPIYPYLKTRKAGAQEGNPRKLRNFSLLEFFVWVRFLEDQLKDEKYSYSSDYIT